MEKLKEDVVKTIRGLLISSKEKTSIRQLERDYKTLIGDRIPYGQLGFRSLQELIRNVPTLDLIEERGEVFVIAKVIQQSAHIAEMVHFQKPVKKKVPKFLRNAPRYSQRLTKPAPPTSRWRPKDTSSRHSNYPMSQRLAAVSHNQFVSYNKPSVPSKVVMPEHSTFNGPTQNTVSMRQKQKEVNVKAVVPPERQIQTSRATKPVKFSTPTKAGSSHRRGETDTNTECLVLSHTKTRLSERFSNMSVNNKKESGNSSPKDEGNVTGNISPPVKPSRYQGLPPSISTRGIEYIQTGDPIVDLTKFVEIYKLGPLEIDTNLIKTKHNRLYTCKIKVDNKTYTSYPKEFSNELEAKKHCATEAFTDLQSKHDRRKCLLISSEKDVLDRIPPLLEKHIHGIWYWQMQLDYADMYKEQLPSDWLKIIDSNPAVQIEKCSDNYILRHCKPENVLQKNRAWKTFTLSDVSVPSNTVQFQEDEKLYAEVTCVMSANEIWCRQCNTAESEAFNEMVANMEVYYAEQKNNLLADKINVDNYYVTEFEDLWYRVRAIADDNGEITFFFIDYGDEMVIAKENVFKLKREFAQAQAQAFVCRLVGLEGLYETSNNSEVLQTILYTQVILELSHENVDDKDQSLPIFMYDFGTGESINEKMIPLLTIESALPVIQKETITKVYVSHIESNGDVYVQVRSHGFTSLKNLMADLEARLLANTPTHLIEPIKKENSAAKMYLGKCKTQNKWYRIQAIDWSPCQELAQIYYVDRGDTDVVNVSKEVLFPLEKLSDILSLYPPQAVKVKMAIDNIPEDFLALANKAMPEEEPVLMKIIGENEEHVPTAEFFRRNFDGGLFCINKSITMEAEIRKNAGVKIARRLLSQDSTFKNVPSGGKLSPPNIPTKGELFEVHVPFAVNPYNFFVQPMGSKQKLHLMMERLQDRYKDVLCSPLSIDQIVPGNIYASKFDDGNWYRTNVLKVIHSGSISVFFCDYGYYGSLTVQQLIKLDIEFLELPYQALKAKLCDVSPKNSKWTMEDCDHFKELVEKKDLFSLLIDTERDQLYDSDRVLKLVLIDTSTEEDVYIGKELIKAGIAVETPLDIAV